MITIIVLLILAGITIASLTGENGIISNAKKANINTIIGKEKEEVSMAYTSAKSKKYITETPTGTKVTASELSEELNDATITVTENGTVLIVLYSNGHIYTIYNDGSIDTSTSDGIYNVENAEEQIASTDIFNYEILDYAKVASTTEMENLPTKRAKITGIKSEYCNGNGYNTDTGSTNLTNTNYEIDANGITDTLVIPYKVEIDDEMYTVTEVSLGVAGSSSTGLPLPNIETIIFPNTVSKITTGITIDGTNTNNKLKKVILPQNLTQISGQLFFNCTALTDVTIPENVTSIGDAAFRGCTVLTNITIPENVTSIGGSAFYACEALTSITFPKNIESIGDATCNSCKALTNVILPEKLTLIRSGAFYACESLTNIIIPENVTKIELQAFRYCKSLTSITIPKNVTSIGTETFQYCTSLTEIYIDQAENSISGAPWDASNATVTWK